MLLQRVSADDTGTIDRVLRLSSRSSRRHVRFLVSSDTVKRQVVLGPEEWETPSYGCKRRRFKVTRGESVEIRKINFSVLTVNEFGLGVYIDNETFKKKDISSIFSL